LPGEAPVGVLGVDERLHPTHNSDESNIERAHVWLRQSVRYGVVVGLDVLGVAHVAVVAISARSRDDVVSFLKGSSLVNDISNRERAPVVLINQLPVGVDVVVCHMRRLGQMELVRFDLLTRSFTLFD
jgi:hypothetical protein